MTELWRIASEELYLLNLMYEAEIHGFVLMPNHIHLMLTTPGDDLGMLMQIFMGQLTKRANYTSGRSGHLFGARYHWSIITSTRYYGNVLKYVYRNPVKAQICNQVEEYEFSTVSGTLGQQVLPFPIHLSRIGLDVNLPNHRYPEVWRDWLNTPFAGEIEKDLQKRMRKKVICDDPEKVSGYFSPEKAEK